MNTPPQMAEIIEKIIKQKSMTVATVLKECDLGKDTIGNMKRNNEPAAKVIATLADYLSISADYIFGKTDDPMPPDKKAPIIDITEALNVFLREKLGREPTSKDIKLVDKFVDVLAQELEEGKEK